MQYAVGLCLRNNGLYYFEMFIVKGVLLCFAYNCKNTVKFNNHVAFFSFFSSVIYLKKLNGIIQILSRT